MVIVGPQIVAGGVSAPPAPTPLPVSRTIANGVLGFLEGGDAKAP